MKHFDQSSDTIVTCLLSIVFFFSTSSVWLLSFDDLTVIKLRVFGSWPFKTAVNGRYKLALIWPAFFCVCGLAACLRVANI